MRSGDTETAGGVAVEPEPVGNLKTEINALIWMHAPDTITRPC